jgi:hypothetical protein
MPDLQGYQSPTDHRCLGISEDRAKFVLKAGRGLCTIEEFEQQSPQVRLGMFGSKKGADMFNHVRRR